MASSKGKEKVNEEPSTNYNGGSNTELGPLPPGYKFDPKDEELIVYYLRPKVNKQQLPPNKMHDVQIYDPQKAEEYSPEQLTASYEPQGKGVWYFFTSRYQKYPNGSRPNRASGGGFWKASGADEPVTFNGDVVGYKRSLVFNTGKQSCSKKTNWLMKEFWLNNDQTNKPQLDKARKSKIDKLDEWVLCKIRYNNKGGSKQEPKKRKCEPSTTNPTPENRPLPECNIMPMPPQFEKHPTHKAHHNQICDSPIIDNSTTNGIWIASQPNNTSRGPSSTNHILEEVKGNDYNLTGIQPPFVGYPNYDPHWSGVTGMPSTSGGVYRYDEFCDPPIMDTPMRCGTRNYLMLSLPNTNTEYGPSNTNFTLLEGVKGTDDCNMSHQFVDPNAHWSNLPSTSGGFYGNNQFRNPSVMDDLTYGGWFGPYPNNNNSIFEIGSTSSFMENDGANARNMGSSPMVDAQSPLPQVGLTFDDGLLKDSTDMFDISFP